jgi:hypothetical protein
MNDLFAALAAADLDEIRHQQRMISDPTYREAYYAKQKAKWAKKMAKQEKKDDIKDMLSHASITVLNREKENLPEKIQVIKEKLFNNNELNIKERFDLTIKLIHYTSLLKNKPKTYQDVVAYYQSLVFRLFFVLCVAVFMGDIVSGSFINTSLVILVAVPLATFITDLISKIIIRKLNKLIKPLV